MRRSTILIISILAMLLLAGSLAADNIYVHVTNTCEVELTLSLNGEMYYSFTFIASPDFPNLTSVNIPPNYPFPFLVTAVGTITVGSNQYTDTDSGYLGVGYPDNLHLYLEFKGQSFNDPPIQD